MIGEVSVIDHGWKGPSTNGAEMKRRDSKNQQ
jgi:hypothetical protein